MNTTTFSGPDFSSEIPMIDAMTPSDIDSKVFIENDQIHRKKPIIQLNQSETKVLDYKNTIRIMNFGSESYQTPLRLVRLNSSTLIYPSLPCSINHIERKKYQRNWREEYQLADTDQQEGYHCQNSLSIPSMESNGEKDYNCSPKNSSFRLQPRARRAFDSPSRLQLKKTRRGTPTFCSRCPVTTIGSDMETSALHLNTVYL